MKNPSDWLNPRRRLYAERLSAYIAWKGRKVILTSEGYADATADTRLDRYAIDQAADDLYQLGFIDLWMAGEAPVLALLSKNGVATTNNGGRK